jgi:hypothetical protein
VALDLNWNLVGRTTDTAGANLDGWTDVVQSLLKDYYWVVTGLAVGALKSTVNDRLGKALLAV